MKNKMSVPEKIGLILSLLLFVITCASLFITSCNYVKNLPSDKFLPEVINYK